MFEIVDAVLRTDPLFRGGEAVGSTPALAAPLPLDVAPQAAVPLVLPAHHLGLAVGHVARAVVALAVASHDEVAAAEADLGALAAQVVPRHPQEGLAAPHPVAGRRREGGDDVDGELDPVVHRLSGEDLGVDGCNRHTAETTVKTG